MNTYEFRNTLLGPIAIQIMYLIVQDNASLAFLLNEIHYLEDNTCSDFVGLAIRRVNIVK